MSLPLVALRSNRSVGESALEARRALNALEAPGAQPTDEEMLLARQRIVAQLSSVAECVHGMASTGLMHTGLDARATMQTSARRLAQDGEWTADTVVTRLPPAHMNNAQWSSELCAAAMSASVVMGVLAGDVRSELIEYRELASMLASDWPELDDSLRERFERVWQRGATSDTSGDTSPGGRAVFAVHANLVRQARRVRVPDEIVDQSAHALDLARRTLQWLGDDVAVLVQSLAE